MVDIVQRLRAGIAWDRCATRHGPCPWRHTAHGRRGSPAYSGASPADRPKDLLGTPAFVFDSPTSSYLSGGSSHATSWS